MDYARYFHIIVFFLCIASFYLAVLLLMRYVARSQRGRMVPRGTFGVNPMNGVPMVTPLFDAEGNLKYFTSEDTRRAY